jgi:hypothetical protein
MAIIIGGVFIMASCNQIDKTKPSSQKSLGDSSMAKSTIAKTPPNDTIQKTNYIEVINSPYTDTVTLEIRVEKKDWFETIYLAQKNKKIPKILIPISSQSILYAEFVDLKIRNAVFFEVYEITHQGNGYYNLFEYKNGLLKNILDIRAVDMSQEGFGIEADSSFIMKDDRLNSEYLDLNQDGYLDIKFSGIGYILKGDKISHEEKANLKNPIELERQFIWNNKTNKFQELMKKRKGFWYYDKYGIEY